MKPISEITVERNLLIPMSDGTRLAADLYRPAHEGRFPVAMSFYPYHKDGLIGAQLHSSLKRFARAGYATLLVDLRGTGGSDGLAPDALDPLRPGDLVDAIGWAAAKPWSAGKVGVWGISYGGTTSLAAGAENPPALGAIAPIMGVAHPYRNLSCPGGALNMGGVMGAWLGLMHAMYLLTPIHRDEAGRWRTLWKERLERYEPHVLGGVDHRLFDEYWERVTIALERIRVPTLVIGGWRDIFPQDCAEQFEGIAGPKRLVMGPWLHTLPGFAVAQAIDEVALILRWFDHWLKGEANGVMDEPAAHIFVQGDACGQTGEWATARSWPPPAVSPIDLYLGEDGRLDAAPLAPERSIACEPDLSVGVESGLASPIPMAIDFPQDQRRDNSRSVCFTTRPLSEAMTIAGSPAVTLWVTPTGGDPTLVAKLCDVDPAGRSSLVTTGWLRLTHREGHDREVPVVAGERLCLKIPLWHTAYRVATGHRLRLAVALSDFPRIWPTPATRPISIDLGPAHPSCLRIPAAGPGAFAPPADALPPSDLSALMEEASVLFQPAWEVAHDVVKERTAVRVGLDMRIEIPGGALCHVKHSYEAEVSHAPPGSPELRAQTRIQLKTQDGECEARSAHRMSEDRIEVECSLSEGGEEVFAKSWAKPWKV